MKAGADDDRKRSSQEAEVVNTFNTFEVLEKCQLVKEIPELITKGSKKYLCDDK